jgi:2'-5' RNA ligase
MEMIRAFIAVPASDEVRAVVTDVETRLRKSGASVKWVRPGNVHVTLKFLGNTPASDVEKLSGVLREALKETPSFEVTVGGVGTFPRGRGKPRVVWLGMESGKERLIETAGKVEDACAELGFEREKRPFAAHLTIGRVRRGSGRLSELAAAVEGIEFKPLQLKVDRVNLVRSRLSPEGPTYTVLESFSLEHH